ncbi:TolB family protein [Dyadobacter sp. MSC1_007]|jgi:hypothetical protein|uniref:TolB family protein n=1 Tax=Dyadobacter sp. MSC1_007 TaxID=2909264 RepID=UPI00202E5BC1|nr:hypothetical protein [Dyadobacter sp. MSC1_007]
MRKLLLSMTVLLAYSCWPPGMDPDKKDGNFLSDVVNLEEFNSEYDDYNSTLPSNRSGDAYLAFSSKRAKKDVFNLVYFPAYLSYDKKLSLKKGKNGAYQNQFVIHDNAESLILKANGDFNVYGPRLISLRDDFINFGTADDLFLFYADDAAGNLDIKYVKRGNHDPELFTILNSTADDAYPTFSWTGDRIYFCSNRSGDYDIYELTIPRTETEKITIESLVHPPKYTLRKVEELSTPYDDKCPYLYHDTMVFVSDRPGGQGGQDIYYSTYENGKWSIPVNPGDRINTSYDEYRPILPYLSNFNYDLMLFSSNRPGGKGGFDLYMTGLKKKY